MGIYVIITAHGVKRQYNNTDAGRQRIYNAIMELTSNHEDAENVSSWCELATIGEIYERHAFSAEICELTE